MRMAEMMECLGIHDRVGLVHPSIDAHTLGISSIEQVLTDCGIAVFSARDQVNDAVGNASDPACARAIRDWIKGNRITALGFSYRLDPDDALRLFSRLMSTLSVLRAFSSDGGTVRLVYFAGLPKACDLIEEAFPTISAVFRGDESQAETLDILGVPKALLPALSAESVAYDETRMAFGEEVVRKGEYHRVGPVDRSDYHRFGQRGDSISARVAHGVSYKLPPVIRAHVGPYLQSRKDAVSLFLEWTRRLALSGLLDVLSIGTSQLSQSEFWRDWEGKDDGGGVPIATAEEFAEVWKAARPMLVRSYAGTRNVGAMARMLEDSIDIAWHALSLWWFCRLDGRGPNTVLENLREHAATLRFIARTGKPFEPNVPHHFAFRGADDLTYVVSGLVAAKAAKAAGVQKLILQVMLNTPKYTWGINDLAKARALLHLVRELEDSDFKVYLQPRGGLDYFSREPARAKAQLAAVTALMDDIEPHDSSSPQIVHVVSYSEGYALADPDVVEESIRITRFALEAYRALREAGEMSDMASNPQVIARTSSLIKDARIAIREIESAIPDPYAPQGLYDILKAGFFAVPYLSECRDEFPNAARLKTKCVNGAIEAVDENGMPISATERFGAAAEAARVAAWKQEE
jgi:hypothetical protein